MPPGSVLARVPRPPPTPPGTRLGRVGVRRGGGGWVNVWGFLFGRAVVLLAPVAVGALLVLLCVIEGVGTVIAVLAAMFGLL